MAITNITKSTPVWVPVKVEMEFKTRDEFAVFLEFLGNPHKMSQVVSGGYAVKHLSASEIEQLIDRMTTHEQYRQLATIRNI